MILKNRVQDLDLVTSPRYAGMIPDLLTIRKGGVYFSPLCGDDPNNQSSR